MAPDNIKSTELDPDRTDRLPILEGTITDEDVADDAVPLERAPVSAAPSASASPAPLRVAGDFSRPAAVDLPSLAESVRSVEERIARQSADYEALSRLYDRARDAESAAAARADALSAELAAAQSTLAVEQHRAREMDRALAERSAAANTAESRVEEALRESERHQGESPMLADALAA